MRVLAAAAGLLDVLVLALDLLGERFAVGDLRGAHVARHVELALEAVHDDFEVELAHAGDDRLGGLLVERDDEGRVFHRERVERDAELFVVLAGLRLHRDGDHRRREVDRLQRNRVLGVAERVARARLGEAHARHDVAGVRLVQGLLLGGVHAEEAGNALLAVDRGVEQFGAELERARVDAHEGDLAAGLRIVHDLERETAERLGVARLALLRRVVGGDRRTRVERGREVVAHAVQQLLHALVLERAAAKRRRDRARDAALADGLLDLVDRQLLAREELLHEGVVLLGRALDHFLAVLLRLLDHVGGNLLRRDRLAEGLHVVAEGLHRDEVDNAAERLAGADRQHHRHGVCAELALHLVHDGVEVRAHAVHLVDERDLRHLVLLALAPHLLGLRLHAADRAVEGDRAIEDAERTLHLGREVHVSGSVDQGEAVGAPHHARGGGLDRNAALLLLHHEVHRRGALVHLADLVVLARIVKDALGRRRLAAVDVGHDAEVAHMVNREGFSCHFCLLLVCSKK